MSTRKQPKNPTARGPADRFAGDVYLLVEERRATIGALRRTNDTLERAHEIHRRLTTAALSGTDSPGVARAVADLVNRPVVVTDAVGNVVASASPSALSRAQSEAPEPGAGGQESTAADVRIPGELLGQVIVGAGDPADAELAQRAAEHAATILALEAVKSRVVQATEDRLRAEYLDELVRGRIADDEAEVARARSHGLTLGAEHRVVVARVEPGGQGDDAALARASAVVRRALAAISGALVSGSGTVTAIVPCSSPDGPATIRKALSTARSQLAGVGSVVAGIGSVAWNIPDFEMSHKGAETCLELALRLGRPHADLARDDLGLLGLFVDAKDPSELVDNAHTILGPALRYDESRSGELLRTLTAYLDCECDFGAAAARLYIHPNTAKYRVRRVEELCGLRLRDPSDLLQARIATLTLALIGS